MREYGLLFYGFIRMMEKVNFRYSIKKIPTQSEKTYLLEQMEKVEMIITIMKWKAIHLNKYRMVCTKITIQPQTSKRTYSF